MSSLEQEVSVEQKYQTHLLSVGEFVIDFRSGKLFSGSTFIASIPPKTLRTLEILILYNDRYLSNAELNSIYSGKASTVDATTRQQISKLRKLLADKDKIKIIREPIGYRLTLPVAPISHPTSEVGEHNLPLNQNLLEKKSYVKHVTVTSLVLGLIIIGYFLYELFESQKVLQEMTVSNYQPLTHMHGLELYPDVSHDGKWLLINYLNPETYTWQIYIKNMATDMIKPLTPIGYSAKYPRWGLNGKAITFTTFENGICKFMLAELSYEKVELVGTRQIKPCGSQSSTAQLVMWKNGQGAFYLEEADYSSPIMLYSYDFKANDTRQLTSPAPTGKGDYFINMARSGKKMVVLRSKHDMATEIWVYDTASWESKLVDTQSISLFRVNWSLDESRLIYKNDHNQIVATDIDSSETTVLKFIPIPFYAPITLDESQNSFGVITGAFSRSVVHEYQISSKTTKVLKDSSKYESLVATTKDGKSIAWISERTGIPQVWLKKQNSNEFKLTDLKRYARFTSLSFSPNGKKLGGIADGHYFILDVESSQIYWSVNSDEAFHNLSWRADNLGFYISRSAQGHRSQLVIDLDSHEKSILKDAPGAYLAMESKDSRFLYTWDFESKQVVRYDRKNQTQQKLDILLELAETNRWSMIDGALLLTRRQNRQYQLLKIEHHSLQPEVLDLNFGAFHITSPAHGDW
ncbi:MAG: hypothetical protein OQJ89_04085, partial [Kangiellaceae bacterium]|nr:hypothetical protein [Kangiellaceae bacterium]